MLKLSTFKASSRKFVFQERLIFSVSCNVFYSVRILLVGLIRVIWYLKLNLCLATSQ